MQTFTHTFKNTLKNGITSILLASFVASMIWPVTGVFAGDQMGPTAVLTVSPSAGSIYTIFDFDAGNSTDSRGFSRNLEYRMNFDYSYEPFTDWGRQSTSSYQFTTSGNKTVILEVRDRENGLTDRTIVTVTVSSDLQFDAGLFVSPLKGDQNTSFQFEVQITTPIAIPASEYEVRYDFDGDNSWDTNFIDQRVAYHMYPSIGYYTPRIEVRDPDGNSIIVTGLEEDNEELGENREDMILVSRTGVPRASLDVYPNVGFSEKSTFYFDASDSFDYEDPAKLLYRFDFENDGIFDTEFSNEPYGQTTYATPGEYTVLVQVEDTEGLKDEAYTTLEVRSEDMAPEPAFSISSDSPLSNDRTTGTLQTTFRFNASRSRDSEDRTSNLQVRWDFENDGTYDTPFSTTKDVTHRYLETGAYTVRLQVFDTAGHTASAIADVSVVANTAPSAHLSISPLAGTPATVFTIDPTSSRDAQYRTSQLQARYDFNGDGRYDTEFERVGRFRYQFSKAGIYKVSMQIRDPEGQVATASETVEILENSAPVAILSVSPNVGTYSTTFVADAGGSFDQKPTSGELKYRFDFDYTGAGDIQYDTNYSSSSSRKVTLKGLGKTGPIQVRVEVKDEDGVTATAVMPISVHWASEYMESLRKNGVMRGYRDGDMKPDQNVTRAELVKMILEARDIALHTRKFTAKYSDVGSRDWFWKYIHTASELGLVSGYGDGSFRPNQNVSRAEALAMILRAYDVTLSKTTKKPFSDVPLNQWYTDYVSTAYIKGIVGGYSNGTFKPHQTMTRGEAAKIVYMASQKFDF